MQSLQTGNLLRHIKCEDVPRMSCEEGTLCCWSDLLRLAFDREISSTTVSYSTVAVCYARFVSHEKTININAGKRLRFCSRQVRWTGSPSSLIISSEFAQRIAFLFNNCTRQSLTTTPILYVWLSEILHNSDVCAWFIVRQISCPYHTIKRFTTIRITLTHEPMTWVDIAEIHDLDTFTTWPQLLMWSL